VRLFKKQLIKKIIVKLHPSQSYYDIRPLIKKIDPKIPLYQSQNILDLIKKCDTMISLNYSTSILDAMILKKPTMTILPEDQNFQEELPIKQGTTIAVSDYHELENSLKNLLNNTEVRNNLIIKGSKFVDEYFAHQGSASSYIVKLLENEL